MKYAFQGHEISITADDILSIYHFITKWKRSEYLRYDVEAVKAAYKASSIRWVAKKTPKGLVETPYELVVDYREWPEDRSWGTVSFADDYHFPGDLEPHRKVMIRRFEKEGRLHKGNNPAPRVKSVVFRDDEPHFELEDAYYYDQVGTNLTLDWPFGTNVEIGDASCRNVRDWDIVQAGVIDGTLPTLEQSRLANTLGIAVGIIAVTESGEKVLVVRKRAKNVAVYPNMWHLPFSFALTYDTRRDDKLNELINPDLHHEFAGELGLERNDLGPLRPIAFCRDLCRGGKPQFFFDMEARLSAEELQARLSGTTPEYVGKPQFVAVGGFAKNPEEKWSPELAAWFLLHAPDAAA